MTVVNKTGRFHNPQGRFTRKLKGKVAKRNTHGRYKKTGPPRNSRGRFTRRH